jgi:DNA-binding NtrC family response regulator
MNKIKILIVDDEKNICLVLSQVLEPLGLEIETAPSGQAALAKLEDPDIHLLLLDIRMPGMDGMEVLRRFRQTRPDVRVVMMTAYGTIDLAVEAMKAGAIDFIQKPFTPKEIRDLVARVLGEGQTRETEYEVLIKQAKIAIAKRELDPATELLRKAIDLDSSRPQAFNLMGCVLQMKGQELEAMKHFQAAVSVKEIEKTGEENLDPTFIY